jgi:hypothetical protein
MRRRASVKLLGPRLDGICPNQFLRAEYQARFRGKREGRRAFTPEVRAARRAAHDPAFKRAEKSRLAKLEKAAIKTPKLRTMLDVIAALVARPSSKTALAKVATERKNLGIKADAKPLPAIHGLCLLTIDAKIARRFGASITVTGQDATLNACLEASHGTHSDPYYTWREGGGVVEQKYLPQVARDGRAEYVRATHDNYVRAFAWLPTSNPEVCYWTIHETTGAVLLPEGFRWAADHNGVHILRASDGMDYHPTTKEITKGNVAQMIRTLENNAELRQKQRDSEDRAERDRFYFDRDFPTVRVTLADSRAAGNCVEGTLAFAERKLHIPREEILAGGHLFSVPAPRLLAAADGDKPRVEAAIHRAWMRETAVCI